MEFQYVIDSSAEEPIMLILTHIGYDPMQGYGVNGNEFLKELLTLDAMGKKRIQIWINSVGGSVIDGWSILGGMLKCKAKVDTYNIGVAASTAGWLFQAGRKRYMSDYAICMEHNPSGGDKEITNLFRDSICTIISERTGMSKEDVYKRMDEETYMNAEQALKAKYCDEIVATGAMNVKRVSQAGTVTDKWLAAQNIVNSILSTKQINTNKMADTKISAAITNKLQLHEAASDVMVVEAIEAVQNKLTVAETNLTLANNKVAELTADRDSYKNKCNDLQSQVDAFKRKAEEAELEAHKVAATNMVKGFATQGKIENTEEVVNEFVGFATAGITKEEREANFERIKNMLTKLPVNKTAAKIETVVTNAVPVQKTAGMYMAEIAAKNGQIR